MHEYYTAGGPPPNDTDMKSDLLRILPQEIRDALIWPSSDEAISFAKFRDHVISQTSRVLLERGRRKAVNSVEEPENKMNEENIIDALESANTLEGIDVEDIIAAIRNQKGRFIPRNRNGRNNNPPP